MNKYEWLFLRSWVDESIDELSEDEINLLSHDQRIEKLRTKALTDIMQEQGIPGIFVLAKKEITQREIGALLVSNILTDKQIEEIILQCLRTSLDYDGLLIGMLRSSKDKKKTIYMKLRSKITEDEALRLLLLSPYRTATWNLVDQLSAEARSRYWVEVVPQYMIHLMKTTRAFAACLKSNVLEQRSRRYNTSSKKFTRLSLCRCYLP